MGGGGGGGGKFPIKPKGKSFFIIVSEFIEEKDNYLALSDQQYELEVENSGDDVEKSALAVLEIGENRQGYWTGERFMEQVTEAVKIAAKSSNQHRRDTTTYGALFDHSCNHTAFAEDALIASKTNKRPWGETAKDAGHGLV